jgi:hypothetical protein
MSDPRIKPRVPSVNPEHPLAKGLVGAWLFQDGIRLSDSSGLSEAGVIQNSGETWETSPYGQAIRFPGGSSGAYMTADKSAVLAHFTISLVFKAPAQANTYWYSLFNAPNGSGGGAADNDIVIWFEARSPYWRYTLQINNLTAGATTGHIHEIDVWTNLVCTYDQTALKIYKNGVLEASSAASVALNQTGTWWEFSGWANDTGGRETKATMASAMIFDRALSEAEIADLYRDQWSLFRQPEPVLSNAPAGGFFEFNQLTGGMPDLRGGMV